jgi:hypothetical protein
MAPGRKNCANIERTPAARLSLHLTANGSVSFLYHHDPFSRFKNMEQRLSWQ